MLGWWQRDHSAVIESRMFNEALRQHLRPLTMKKRVASKAGVLAK